MTKVPLMKKYFFENNGAEIHKDVKTIIFLLNKTGLTLYSKQENGLIFVNSMDLGKYIVAGIRGSAFFLQKNVTFFYGADPN